MNNNSAVFREKHHGSPQKSGLIVKICDQMVHVLNITLESVRLENSVDLSAGVFDLTLYPVDKNGEAQMKDGIKAAASVTGKDNRSITLAFETSTYPLSKLIIRTQALQQGIKPYHLKIGL